jgi:S-DNA-T family DNA segregation ATPase FtsK/SpoIIIE
VAGSSSVSRRLSEVVGVALFAAALIWVIALASYEPTDPAWFFSTGLHSTPVNFAGRVGAFLAELSFQLFGYASYVIPAVLVGVGWNYFWCRKPDAAGTKAAGAVLLFACISAFLSLVFGTLDVSGKPFRAGGYAGDFLAREFSEYLARTGALIVILALIFLGVIMSTQFSFGRFFGAILESLKDGAIRAVDSFHEWREERRREKQRREVIAKHTKKGTITTDTKDTKVTKDTKESSPRKTVPAIATAMAAVKDTVANAAAAGADLARARVRKKSDEDDDTADTELEKSSPWASARSFAPAKPPKVTMPAALPDPETTSKAPAERRKGEYTLPPVTLLDAPKAERKIDERELMDGARMLEEKCREFSVEGAVVQIHPGPVVTTYEFKPDAGVKYAKVTNLSDDLCLAMQAESVLIDRIPGKSTVGIQIPNHTREPISLRELLESEKYRKSSSKLTVALGKTIHGEPYMADLTTMPHLLIAGSTGAGKSVGINGMLTSILYRATPDDVRLIMVDPKRLELGMYDDIPHLLTPVVVDPKQAANALRWAVREMEERYKLLAAEGVRNIEQFNRNMQQSILEKREPEEGKEFKALPFIVVVIDELADLMMVAGNEVEESIARLAQMARAVGIHLILATQRPSVDVITGLIKANLPARIAFRVCVEDRLADDSRRQRRRAAARQGRHAVPAARVVALHPLHGRTSPSRRPRASPASCASRASRLRRDHHRRGKDGQRVRSIRKGRPLRRSARIIVSSGQASISYLQRRLRIGFSRAARLVDMMEMEGLVSPRPAAKPAKCSSTRTTSTRVDAQLR